MRKRAMMERKGLTGVILAAGMARRLRPLTDNTPKCLLTIGGRSLLQRTVDALISAGVDRLAVVTGYRAGMIHDEIDRLYPDLDVTYIHNADYENNNNIFSLWLARSMAEGRDFVLTDSDILCDPALIREIAGAEDNALALNRHEMGPEEMKVVPDSEGRAMRITKDCDPKLGIGESVGVEKITAEYSAALYAELRRMIEDEGLKDMFYELAFERLAAQGHRFRIVDTTDYFSMELDTPEDFAEAENNIPDNLR